MPGNDVKSFVEERAALHQTMAELLLHYVASDDGQPALLAGARITSNADSSSAISVRIGARLVFRLIDRPPCGWV